MRFENPSHLPGWHCRLWPKHNKSWLKNPQSCNARFAYERCPLPSIPTRLCFHVVPSTPAPPADRHCCCPQIGPAWVASKSAKPLSTTTSTCNIFKQMPIQTTATMPKSSSDFWLWKTTTCRVPSITGLWPKATI